ncbi:putative cytosolic iron-sulfur protein assembly protein 1 [Staphylotrichum tortipilum]|uniref:Probable cytosolic iron-sulfur protein assembly protein 1 n=1 Tax=Staphylotrichum tortipilum TaxID=2831512 RepID=A0AAN6MD85_9PEZI|nr:putative cytosolic iron-sulfur protein assembly protein 1 [Staphylotrichum longicolle]
MTTSPPPPSAAAPQKQQPTSATLTPLPPFQPDLYQRAWSSIPHPTLPLLATAHAKSVTVFSLATLTKHSALTGGHARSVRTAAWQPARGSGNTKRLGLVTGSFDATAGMWSFDEEEERGLEREVRFGGNSEEGDDDNDGGKEWEFNLVLEGHENEVKGLAFSPGGQYLATCSRDKSVWIWEDVSSGEGDGTEDDWETVAVLSEHDGDVKAVAWCPVDLPNAKAGARRGNYSADVLASASYDNTVRIWREDADGEWVCVDVLTDHEGTVWGLQWETKPRDDGKFPRLMTFSADGTIKVWSLREEETPDEPAAAEDSNAFRSNFGALPNTLRRSLREEWDCTAVLPKVHTRDIYSVAWSADTGLVASTGSDGIVAVYAEVDESEALSDKSGGEQEGEDVVMTSPSPQQQQRKPTWKVLGTISSAHGPYEVNHVTWCKRFDAGAAPERRGREEMLVTTGDDGVVRPWQARIA